jgi:hypothetical protein
MGRGFRGVKREREERERERVEERERRKERKTERDSSFFLTKPTRWHNDSVVLLCDLIVLVDTVADEPRLARRVHIVSPKTRTCANNLKRKVRQVERKHIR